MSLIYLETCLRTEEEAGDGEQGCSKQAAAAAAAAAGGEESQTKEMRDEGRSGRKWGEERRTRQSDGPQQPFFTLQRAVLIGA